MNAADLAAVEAAQNILFADVIERQDGAERVSFVFGEADALAKTCIVLSGRPNGDRVSLKLAVDDPAVHDAAGTTPTEGGFQGPRDPIAPVIGGLIANFRQGQLEPILDATWFPAVGAQYYVAQISYNGGTTWEPNNVYEGIFPGFSAIVDRANLRLRVAGVGRRHGAFTVIDVTVPDITLGPDRILSVMSPSQKVSDSLSRSASSRLRTSSTRSWTSSQTTKSRLNQRPQFRMLDVAELLLSCEQR
jgi:hypothetical protein